MNIDITKLNKIDTELVLPSTSENISLQKLQENKWGSILNNQTFNTLNNNIKILKNSLVETINTLNNESIITNNKYINENNNVISLGDSTKKLNFLTTQIQVNGIDTEFLTSQNLSNISNIAYKDKENTFTYPLNTNQYNINSNQVITDDNININLGNNQRKLNLQSSDGKLYLKGVEFNSTNNSGSSQNTDMNYLNSYIFSKDILGGDFDLLFPEILYLSFYNSRDDFLYKEVNNSNIVSILKSQGDYQNKKTVFKNTDTNKFIFINDSYSYDRYKYSFLMFKDLGDKFFNYLKKIYKKNNNNFYEIYGLYNILIDFEFKINGKKEKIYYNNENFLQQTYLNDKYRWIIKDTDNYFINVIFNNPILSFNYDDRIINIKLKSGQGNENKKNNTNEYFSISSLEFSNLLPQSSLGNITVDKIYFLIEFKGVHIKRTNFLTSDIDKLMKDRVEKVLDINNI